MNKLVSIITPTYNAEKYIEDVYSSLCSQSHTNWEWLITDDCSSDNTRVIIESLSINDPRVKMAVNDFNSGAAVSRNNSLSRAVGDFIAFIDSDDIWFSDKLEKQIVFMKDDIDFSFTAYETISSDGKRLGQQIDTFHTEPLSYQDMLMKKATLGCSTVLLRRGVIDDLSMPLLRTGQDYALWLKILKTGVKAYALTEVLTQYRIVSGSISRNKVRKARRQWEIYRQVEKLKLHHATICFISYAWRAVFRR
ncbi:glycosyltransferase family 2 protein [Erwinia sp. SLM-02]|uniref:glycosyltransferase family 2 protein n=1 Tax=Erwinia sp. SLM-02 TaxID=3020057 RepID=UPI0030809B00